MNRPPYVLLCVLAAVSLRCAAEATLSEQQLAKADIHLRPLLRGTGQAGGDCVSRTGTDGDTVFSVLIRGNADDLRARGIPLASVIGDICTAALTVDQLREAVRVTSVRSLECGSKNSIHDPAHQP